MISSSNIISRSISVYKNNFLDYVKYIVLGLLPGAIMGGLFLVFGSAAAIGIVGSGMSSTASLVFGVILFAIIVLFAIGLSLWVNFAFIRMIGLKARGEDTEGVLDNFIAVRSKFWRAIGASIVMSIYGGWPLIVVSLFYYLYSLTGAEVSGSVLVVFALLGLAALFLGIYFFVRVFFSVFHVILGDADIFEAIDYSQDQVIGSWFGVFWRLIAPAIVFFIISILAQILLGGLSAVIDATAVSLLLSLLLFAIQVLVPPLFPTAQVVLYNDLANSNPSLGEDEDSSVDSSKEKEDKSNTKEGQSEENQADVDLNESLDS
ncbi:MAG: hypothetical protein ABEJ24_00385 [Candidatus Magasanikbacteria bacterium]